MRKIEIGIDIGHYSIKCAVLKKVNDTYVIKHKETYRVSGDEEKIDSAFIKKSLKEFMGKYKIRRANLNFSIPFISPDVQFRFFDMPTLPPKDLSKGIRHKIEGATLSDFDSIYYKWEVFSKDDDNCRVFVVNVQQSLINEIKKIKKSGCTITRIEPEVVSLGRLVKKNSAVIDFGERGTRLIIYRDGFPVFINVIDIGGKDFTDNISKRYPENPEDIKHKFGAIVLDRMIETNPNVLAIADLVYEIANDLAMELKQSLRIAEVEQGVELDKIYFTGGASHLRYLIEYLSHEIGYEMAPLSLSSDEDHPYAIACGASLDDSKYLKNINFSKVKPVKKRDSRGAFYIILGFVLIIQLGMYYLNTESNERLFEIIAENNSIVSEISSIDGDIMNAQREIFKYQEIESALNRIQGEETVVSKILYELPNRLPESIYLNEINVDSNKMTFRGTYETYSDVGIFAIALEKIGAAKIEALGGGNFTISFKPNVLLFHSMIGKIDIEEVDADIEEGK